MVKNSNTNNSSRIFVPGITGVDLEGIDDTVGYQALGLTAVLLVWRAQLAIILSNWLPSSEIQQLESMRWIARSFTNVFAIRELAAFVAVKRSIGFEFEALSGLTSEQRKAYITQLVKELADSTAPRNARLLNVRELNAANIESHRHAIMNQLFGLWQSYPIHNPTLVFKGQGLSTLDFATLTDLIQTMVANITGNPDAMISAIDLAITVEADLGLIPSQYIDNLYADPSSTEPAWENIRGDYNYKRAAQHKFQVFNDGINFGNARNCTPLENNLTFVRPLPIVLDKVALPDDEDDIFIKSAAASRNQMVKTRISVKTNSSQATDPVSTKSGKAAKASPIVQIVKIDKTGIKDNPKQSTNANSKRKGKKGKS